MVILCLNQRGCLPVLQGAATPSAGKKNCGTIRRHKESEIRIGEHERHEETFKHEDSFEVPLKASWSLTMHGSKAR
jgi:hypothetical protein